MIAKTSHAVCPLYIPVILYFVLMAFWNRDIFYMRFLV